jgi:hypothetical protein
MGRFSCHADISRHDSIDSPLKQELGTSLYEGKAAESLFYYL